MKKRPIAEYDHDTYPVVLLNGPEFAHPTTGYCYEGEWMFMVNDHDLLLAPGGSFSRSYVIEVPEVTEFWDLPK